MLVILIAVVLAYIVMSIVNRESDSGELVFLPKDGKCKIYVHRAKGLKVRKKKVFF